MALVAGSRLGPYTVLGPLGTGAMGEVYRAHDERLGRDVALKILSPAVAQDADRVERFAREARLLASLNHPNIGAIHGLEDATDSTAPALVLELVAGSTLEERLGQGPIPLDAALALARDIADALDAAHERGIVHRDLKPANIKITPSGTAKVLDFGIAKVLEDGQAGSTATRTASRPHAGAVIGSPAYMSPEQARGDAVDRRTDIWSFGCVLFEMVSGTRAFPGTTASDAIAAVLSRDPDWRALPAPTPPGITRLLRRCLQKDVRRRLRDIGDVRADLEDAVVPIEDNATVAASSRLEFLLPWMLAAVLAAAWIGTWLLMNRRTAGTDSAPAVVRTQVVLPATLTLATTDTASPLALSSDGSTIAFVTERDGRSELYARRLSEADAVRLASGSGSMKPFFSPDGKWLAFVSGGTLQKIEVAGGSPIRICNVGDGFFGGAWSPDGQMVGARRDGLFSVPSGGGTVTPIPGTAGAAWPHITPDGKTVLFTHDGGKAIARMPLAGGPVANVARLTGEGAGQGPAILGVGGSLVQVQLVSSGYLVYGQSPGIVMALPVDPQSLRPTGAPMPLADPVERGRNSGGVYYAVSRTGLLVYAPTGRQHRLVWVTRGGVETPLGADSGDFRVPVLSPDDSSVVVGMNDETRRIHIWLYDAVRGTRRELGPGLEFAWHPDGRSIAAGDGGLVSIATTPGAARHALTESNSLRALLPEGTNPYPTSWSRDGRYLLFQADERQVWVLDVATKQARPLIAEANKSFHAAFSPDMRWIVYESNASGRNEVWLRSFPELANTTQVSLNGGGHPRWSQAGREIVYREGDAMMSVAIDTSARPQVGRPVRLFAGYYEGAGHAATFSVSRDGQRFVMVKGDPASRLDRLAVVQHLFENLNQPQRSAVSR
jgi:Tol biopolymer transport system component